MIRNFESYGGDQEVVITHKSEHGPVILMVVGPDDRVKKVSADDGLHFPFRRGDRVKWSRLSEWACENDFLIDGKDMCPDDGGFLQSSLGRMFGR